MYLRAHPIVFVVLVLSLAANVGLGVRELLYKRDLQSLKSSYELAAFPGPTNAADRRQVDCGKAIAHKRAAVLFIFGQSNAANTIDTHSEASAGIVNFSIYDGKCYEAREPLLGATSFGGSFATHLASKLVDREVYETVIVVPIAVGGSFIKEWAPDGGLHARLITALNRVVRVGLPITHLLWHQGEAEANHTQMTRAEYAKLFHAMLAGIRAKGVGAPIWVATTTYCAAGPQLFHNAEEIRAAQIGLANITAGVFAGPDTDQLSNEFRYDACHLNARGAERHAELWYEAIQQPQRRAFLCCESR